MGKKARNHGTRSRLPSSTLFRAILASNLVHLKKNATKELLDRKAGYAINHAGTRCITSHKVDWRQSAAIWGGTSCLDIILKYLPGAVSSLTGGIDFLIEKGMSKEDAIVPHVLKWPKHLSPHTFWRPWFAWHPVTVKDQTIFLKTVEREDQIHGSGPETCGISYNYRFSSSVEILPKVAKTVQAYPLNTLGGAQKNFDSSLYQNVVNANSIKEKYIARH